jgi:hypothetical protein
MKKDLWLARDKDGDLYLYGGKPALLKGDSCFDSDEDGWFSSLPNELYPEVTFLNSPIEVTLTLHE